VPQSALDRDLESFAIVELDRSTCELAAAIAEQTGARTLDALHLGAIQRAGGAPSTLVTFDLRQAQAARALGVHVLGT
jgi:predicted nucleic acid-binding protein